MIFVPRHFHPVRPPASDVAGAVTDAFRGQWRQIVAAAHRVTGDWDVAEECAQDAFARAVERWPADGVPSRPGAWLTTAARNRAIDRRRRDALGRDKLLRAAPLWHRAARTPDDWSPGAVADERLGLIFACCHPALPPETSAALALRAVAGLSTKAVARAFGVTEMTMAKRLARAKLKIRHANIPLRIPPACQLAERTDAVLRVLRLMFDEGCAGAEPLRLEAIRLARALAELMPNDAGARALLADIDRNLTQSRKDAKERGAPLLPLCLCALA